MIKVLFFLLFPAIFFSQEFNGEIVYKHFYIPKTNKINLDSIKELRHGDISKYIISESNYKSTYFKDGQESYSYLYDNISKRMYDNYAKKSYLTYRDSKNLNFKYDKAKIYKDSLVKILGRECYMVEYKSTYGLTKTYYSNEIKVNPENFKDHHTGNWYEKLKETGGCLSMKSITEFEDHFEVIEAVEINERKVDREEFETPRDKIIVAASSALDENAKIIPLNQEQFECYSSKLSSVNLDTHNLNEFITYVGVIVNKNGEAHYIEAYEQDEFGFYKIAETIIKDCDFNYEPGKIGNRLVSSLFYIPIKFER